MILKLIINNDTILTNNMIKSKRPTYLYFESATLILKLLIEFVID